MPKTWFLMLMAGLLVGPALARQKWANQSAVLKARQKEELQILKLKQRYARSSLENSHLPKAVRIQLKHELKSQQRALRQRQKDERQKLKDRERLLKLELSRFQYE